MLDAGEVRKRLLHTIDAAKKSAATRRSEVERARAAFDTFLSDVAAPVFRHFAQALKAHGYPFQVFTPAGVVRLVSDRTADDVLEIELETSGADIAVVGRTNRVTGRRVVETEDVLHTGPDIEALDDEAVLRFLLERIVPFVER